jgi:hypothetical protein
VKPYCNIPNAALRLSDIPTTGGDDALNAFALSFPGYSFWGSPQVTGYIANRKLDRTLTELRTCLFFEARRARHLNIALSSDYTRSLLEKIREKVRNGKTSDLAPTTNEKLRLLYSSFVDSWKQEKSLWDFRKLSMPLLPFVGDGYESAKRKLLVVGQQTKGWCGHWADGRTEQTDIILKELEKIYREFYFGKTKSRSIFLKAVDTLVAALASEDISRETSVWANVLPFDNDERAPTLELQELFGRAELLSHIINVTKPDAVVFLSGHHYDAAIFEKFHGLKNSAVGKDAKLLSKLSVSELPGATYRTYHPNFLRRGKWAVLAQIADLIRADWRSMSPQPTPA